MNAYFNPHEPAVVDWLISNSDYYKKILIQTPVDGSPQIEWQSATAADKALRICKGTIARAIRTGSVTVGSKWSYRIKE